MNQMALSKNSRFICIRFCLCPIILIMAFKSFIAYMMPSMIGKCSAWTNRTVPNTTFSSKYPATDHITYKDTAAQTPVYPGVETSRLQIGYINNSAERGNIARCLSNPVILIPVDLNHMRGYQYVTALVRNAIVSWRIHLLCSFPQCRGAFHLTHCYATVCANIDLAFHHLLLWSMQYASAMSDIQWLCRAENIARCIMLLFYWAVCSAIDFQSMMSFLASVYFTLNALVVYLLFCDVGIYHFGSFVFVAVDCFI